MTRSEIDKLFKENMAVLSKLENHSNAAISGLVDSLSKPANGEIYIRLYEPKAKSVRFDFVDSVTEEWRPMLNKLAKRLGLNLNEGVISTK